ncbi:hypothetical protein C8R45DRAFT_935687 [Mycena sanguinolenta]|nr:hypothetical protein C8R45DRAFT_935687 [Mycena sanguinolenta]
MSRESGVSMAHNTARGILRRRHQALRSALTSNAQIPPPLRTTRSPALPAQPAVPPHRKHISGTEPSVTEEHAPRHSKPAPSDLGEPLIAKRRIRACRVGRGVLLQGRGRETQGRSSECDESGAEREGRTEPASTVEKKYGTQDTTTQRIDIYRDAETPRRVVDLESAYCTITTVTEGSELGDIFGSSALQKSKISPFSEIVVTHLADRFRSSHEENEGKRRKLQMP